MMTMMTMMAMIMKGRVERLGHNEKMRRQVRGEMRVANCNCGTSSF